MAALPGVEMGARSSDGADALLRTLLEQVERTLRC
jgi:hypothetical protein